MVEVTGNLILRLLLGESGFAPYFIGSGDRRISPRYEWVYGGGVGLEYRFNPSTGIFSDAGFLWADKAPWTTGCLSAPDCGLFFNASHGRRFSAKVQDQFHLPKLVAALRLDRLVQRRKIIRLIRVFGPTSGLEKLTRRGTPN